MARDFHRKISEKMPNINLIDDNIDSYDNKVCVISAFNSKGLEFDGVIIVDSDKYFVSEQDRNILYVSATRALHKLSIVSIEKTSKFVENYIKIK